MDDISSDELNLEDLEPEPILFDSLPQDMTYIIRYRYCVFFILICYYSYQGCGSGSVT
jgi:hypothetical protein